MSYYIKLCVLHNFLKSCKEKDLKKLKDLLVEFLINEFKLDYTKETKKYIKARLNSSFCNNYFQRLQKNKKANHGYPVLEKINSEWLNNEFSITFCDKLFPEYYKPGKLLI